MFANGILIIKFKAKDSENVTTPLCLGNNVKYYSVNNMKNTGLNCYVYDFYVGYNAIAVIMLLQLVIMLY